MHKYQRLSTQLAQEVEQGLRKVGDKMPSLRQFAHQQGIGMTTAIRTYEQLQDQGYLAAKHKSGFYVTKPAVAENQWDFLHFKSEVRKLSANYSLPSKQLNKMLSTAQVSPDLMPLKSLRRAIKNAFERQSEASFLYGEPQGTEMLRESLAHHYQANGFAISKQQLLVTNGCINAVSLALQCVSEPGDCIAVSSPCYQGLLQLLAMLGRKVIEIPSTREGLDLEQLQALASSGQIKACLLTANQQNPTGHNLGTEQKQQLAELAAKTALPVIEDDVFGELIHQGPMPLPIKAWDNEGYVIWCSSASKTLAPGLRLGWCAPGRYLAAMTEFNKTTTMGLNSSIQDGLARFIQTGHYARHVSNINRTLAEHMVQYRRYLVENLPSNVSISSPRGGLVLWLKLPGMDGESLALKASDSGFELRGGKLFSSRDFYGDHLRINVGWPFEQAQPWLEKLIELVNPLHKSKRL